MERSAPRPVRIGVDRFPDEIVPEGGASRFDLVEQTAIEELGDARVAAELREELQLDLDADHTGSLESGSSRVRQALGSDA